MIREGGIAGAVNDPLDMGGSVIHPRESRFGGSRYRGGPAACAGAPKTRTARPSKNSKTRDTL